MPEKTFWQIIADDHVHPFWLLCGAVVIVVAVYVGVNSFDLRGTEGKQILYLLVGLGGLNRAQRLAEWWKNHGGGGGA